jgi:hypothetical protein
MSDENAVVSVQTSGSVPALTHETASTAVAAQARAMVEARYLMAKHCPRDIDAARQALLRECKRPGFAEAAIYNKPIGKGIKGPSIRFAEAAIRCLKNIDVQTMTVYDDEEKRIVRVSACDLEANTVYSQDVTIQKTVERNSPAGYEIVSQRTNKQNQIVYIVKATDDDILNKQNALISKAVRTLGLRLVPGDLIDESMDACMETQRTKDAVDPDAAKRKLFDAFGTVGVTVDQIKKYLGNEATTLTPKELSDLRGLYSAIKDGETSWAEAMDARQPKAAEPAAPAGKGVSGLKAAIKPATKADDEFEQAIQG